MEAVLAGLRSKQAARGNQKIPFAEYLPVAYAFIYCYVLMWKIHPAL